MTNILVTGGKIGLEISKMAYPDIEADYGGYNYKTRKRDYYDQVIDYHSLQLIPNRSTVDYLVKLRGSMVVGGFLNLFVPALEWAADQVVNEENPSPLTLIHLFGNQQGPNQDHKSGHTMRSLRRDLALAGFAVTHASVGAYTVMIKGPGGEPVEAEAGQHVLIAYKREEKDNAVYEEIRK